MKPVKIADVEAAINKFKEAMSKDQSLEATSAKKLASAVELLTLKDGVTKDLNQAYTHAHNKWAKNALEDEMDGCKKDNKDEKIMQYVKMSTSYFRHINDPENKDKVDAWLADKFPKTLNQEAELIAA